MEEVMEIIVLVPELEQRQPKKLDVMLTSDGRLWQPDFDADLKRTCYHIHKIEVPKWATKIVPHFENDVDKFCYKAVIRLPQPEKRCRWQVTFKGTMLETKERFTEKEMLDRFDWPVNLQPIEDSE